MSARCCSRPGCENPLPPQLGCSRKGRPAIYCSDECRSIVNRERDRAARRAKGVRPQVRSGWRQGDHIIVSQGMRFAGLVTADGWQGGVPLDLVEGDDALEQAELLRRWDAWLAHFDAAYEGPDGRLPFEAAT